MIFFENLIKLIGEDPERSDEHSLGPPADGAYYSPEKKICL